MFAFQTPPGSLLVQTLLDEQDLIDAGIAPDSAFVSSSDLFVWRSGKECFRYVTVAYGRSEIGAWRLLLLLLLRGCAAPGGGRVVVGARGSLLTPAAVSTCRRRRPQARASWPFSSSRATTTRSVLRTSTPSLTSSLTALHASWRRRWVRAERQCACSSSVGLLY